MGWQDQENILGEGFGMGLSASGVSRECSQGLCLYGIKYQCFYGFFKKAPVRRA